MSETDEGDERCAETTVNAASKGGYSERTIGAVREGLGQSRRFSTSDCTMAGRQLRHEVPRSSWAEWKPAENRPCAAALLAEQEQTRVPELVPLRHQRMAASPFSYLRGAALPMAFDLSHMPTTGLVVQACGDAHVGNFGIFASPERSLMFDINDFDETSPGPWEWDVCRLAASIEVCGRTRGFRDDVTHEAVRGMVEGYRQAMRGFAQMGNMEMWYSRLDVEDVIARHQDNLTSRMTKSVTRTISKAADKTSGRAVERLTEVVGGQLRIKSNPPLVTPLRDLALEDFIPLSGTGVDTPFLIDKILCEYRKSLPLERQTLMRQYAGVDLARKVVGVGSVGMRCWIIVLRGRDDTDHLVLQLKEAQESVLERFAGPCGFSSHGERVIMGQRAMQTSRDLLLGWARLNVSGRDRDFYVRQLWDNKGSFDLETIGSDGLVSLGRLCAWTLAHAHARTENRFALAGYLGHGDAFDRSMVAFAKTYADQTERDYEAYVRLTSTR